VIAITARCQRSRIVYKIVDKYETRFQIKPKTSTQPLSMGELIALIDSTVHHDALTGLTSVFRNFNAENRDDPATLVDFVVVTSDFYPELRVYYAEEAREWLAAVQASAGSGGGRRDG
jgi:hypothetical protein